MFSAVEHVGALEIKNQLLLFTSSIVLPKERDDIKGTTKQKMTRRHRKEGGHHLDWNRKATEDNGGATPCSGW